MNTCTRCPQPARWRDHDGRQFCGSHVPANGKPVTRLPVTDIADRLEAIAAVPADSPFSFEILGEAAGEIRRLRAELDKSGAC